MKRIENIIQAYSSEGLSDLHTLGNGVCVCVETGTQTHQIASPALSATLTGFPVFLFQSRLYPATISALNTIFILSLLN